MPTTITLYRRQLRLFRNAKLVCCWAVCLLFGYKTFAQSWYAGIAGGADYSSIMDKEFSSLSFTGMGASGAATIGYQGKRFTHAINVTYIYGVLANTLAKQDELTHAMMEITCTSLINLSQESTFIQWRPGAALGYLYSQRSFDRFINKQDATERLVFLSAVADITVPIGNTHHGAWSANNRTQLPLFTMLSRALSSARDNWHYAAPFGDAVYVTNELSLQYGLNDRHAASLGYNWHYYRLKQAQEIRRTSHQLTIAYIYKW